MFEGFTACAKLGILLMWIGTAGLLVFPANVPKLWPLTVRTACAVLACALIFVGFVLIVALMNPLAAIGGR